MSEDLQPHELRGGLIAQAWANPWLKALMIALSVASVSWAIRETAVITGPLLGALQTALVPLAIGFTTAYVLTPLIDVLQRIGIGRHFGTALVFLALSVGGVLGIALVMPPMLRQSSELLTRSFQDFHFFDRNGNGHFDKGEPIVQRASDERGPFFFHDLDGNQQPGADERRFPVLDQAAVRVRLEPSLLRRSLAWAESTGWRVEVLLDREPEPAALAFLAFYQERCAGLNKRLDRGLAAAEAGNIPVDWVVADAQGGSWPRDWPGPTPAVVNAAAEQLPPDGRQVWLASMVAYGQRLAQTHLDLLEAWAALQGESDQIDELAGALADWLDRPITEERLEAARQRLYDLRASSREADRQLLHALYRRDEGAGDLVQQMLDEARMAIQAKVNEFSALAGEGASAAIENLGDILQFALDIFLVPIYAFFLTMVMPHVRSTLRRYVPIMGRERVVRLTHEVEKVVAAFFRGRLIVCILCGILVSIGFLLLNVPYALLFGICIGLATAVPLAGLVFLIPALLLVAVDGGEGMLVRLSLVMLVYTIVQTLEATVFTPTIMGREVELHPVLLILALVFFGGLLGILGLLLAVPIAATLRILAREFLLPRVRAAAGVPATIMLKREASDKPDEAEPPRA